MSVKKRRNWHRADIVAALRKKDTSLSELGRLHGKSIYTLKNALDKPYVNGEKLIAEALGLEPADIWPERYE
ncbi:TPA: helix-turn-helix domain-containing protein [Serratia marcescens]|uniref:helix-turn-helix domain-containing protein n=1 Tax=Serratia sp. CY56810 TaxID=3383642 RepID=UPI0029D4E36A|nr:helix-turn-helix domain-containing protein [Serratia marcescens]HBL7018625.1 helix-turn-helix domain-containing protein [Serratia marcescens]